MWAFPGLPQWRTEVGMPMWGCMSANVLGRRHPQMAPWTLVHVWYWLIRWCPILRSFAVEEYFSLITIRSTQSFSKKKKVKVTTWQAKLPDSVLSKKRRLNYFKEKCWFFQPKKSLWRTTEHLCRNLCNIVVIHVKEDCVLSPWKSISTEIIKRFADCWVPTVDPVSLK